MDCCDCGSRLSWLGRVVSCSTTSHRKGSRSPRIFRDKNRRDSYINLGWASFQIQSDIPFWIQMSSELPLECHIVFWRELQCSKLQDWLDIGLGSDLLSGWPSVCEADRSRLDQPKKIKCEQSEGHIAQINAPRFAEDRNMWVMMVKEVFLEGLFLVFINSISYF